MILVTTVLDSNPSLSKVSVLENVLASSRGCHLTDIDCFDFDQSDIIYPIYISIFAIMVHLLKLLLVTMKLN